MGIEGSDKARKIYADLGGDRFCSATGAHSFIGDQKSLSFRLPACVAKEGVFGVRITAIDKGSLLVPHRYLKASDNSAQWAADQIGRQEVTPGWYAENMPDYALFRWIEGQDEFGLDPWRYYADLPISPEEAAAQDWRTFVQRQDVSKAAQRDAKTFISIGRPVGPAKSLGAYVVFVNCEAKEEVKGYDEALELAKALVPHALYCMELLARQRRGAILSAVTVDRADDINPAGLEGAFTEMTGLRTMV